MGIVKSIWCLIIFTALEIVFVGELWVLRVAIDWWLNIDYVEEIKKWLTRE